MPTPVGLRTPDHVDAFRRQMGVLWTALHGPDVGDVVLGGPPLDGVDESGGDVNRLHLPRGSHRAGEGQAW